jgi:catechol 2,3-dioxygenase-like lactoylglutathione lyase family enzyme
MARGRCKDDTARSQQSDAGIQERAHPRIGHCSTEIEQPACAVRPAVLDPGRASRQADRSRPSANAGRGKPCREVDVLRNPDHVTIAVADAASAIELFALLGFRQERFATIDGGPPAQYMGMPDMKAKHITLVLEGCEPRFEVQLLEFEPRPPADTGEHPTSLRRRGYNHLAFRVDDIKAVTAHLVAKGVTMLSDEMDYLGRRLRLFEGPEGITLELVQRADPDSKQG